MADRDEDEDHAVEKYEEFHRFDPKRLTTLPELVIPKRVRKLGDGQYVLYRSDKIDPSTLKKPTRPIDYIHEFNAGVTIYANIGRPDTEVPKEFTRVKALVHLGKCLGFGVKNGPEAEARDPLPDLSATPDGKCLLVIQSGRRVLAMIWGGALGVHPRGIDG